MRGRGAAVGLVGVMVAAPPAGAAEAHLDVPAWTAAPFVLILLAIAVLPLVAGHFWHKNSAKALVAALLAVPVALFLVLQRGEPGMHALSHVLQEYVSFMILLASLYTVAGGVVLRGGLRGTPAVNAAFLALGAVLANLVGTTGASMLLIRPVLRINAGRPSNHHVPIFFIFIVSNLGGLLTPLGDPPLFLGFLRGVDFFWTLRLWPQWLLANGLVLAVFLAWDTLAYRKERTAGTWEDTGSSGPLRLEGLVNLLLLGGILVAVLFQAPRVADAARGFLARFFPCPDLLLTNPWGEVLMAATAGLSLLLTPGRLRKANAFSWGPIVEVAVLFAGIFVTMVPMLVLLREHGRDLAVTEPWQFFWMTGTLSSVLDNAPTYMAFATLAASPEPLATLQESAPLLLAAVSCGAVFMGANTYIGNGPNFMVKAIAEEAGYRMPTFLGYLAYSGLILLPIFALLTLVFFRP